MLYKSKMILLSVMLILINLLLIFVEINNVIIVIIIILLNLLTLILFYDIRKSKKPIDYIIEQGKNILNGHLSSRILLKQKGKYSELAIIFNEITEKLQEEIITSKEAEVARKRLLANISHDIRTPLTSILGYVEALRDDLSLDRKEKEKYLKTLVKKAENLKELIDDIFLMARLDAGEFEMDFQPCDLAEITRESLIDFIPEIKKEDIKTEINIPEKSCEIYADYLSVKRLIQNIMKNSLHYGKNGGYIGVRLTSENDGYILYIEDRGSGIKKEDIPYIFERHYIGDRSRNKSSSGTGLGLTIAKKLIERYDGSIKVESIEGEKTVFKIIFPRKKS